jgi:hypothetical protein
MARQTPAVEAMVRQAFGLLLEIRDRREAKSLLAKAIAFLKLLQQDRTGQANPLVVTIQAVRIRDL